MRCPCDQRRYLCAVDGEVPSDELMSEGGVQEFEEVEVLHRGQRKFQSVFLSKFQDPKPPTLEQVDEHNLTHLLY